MGKYVFCKNCGCSYFDERRPVRWFCLNCERAIAERYLRENPDAVFLMQPCDMGDTEDHISICASVDIIDIQCPSCGAVIDTEKSSIWVCPKCGEKITICRLANILNVKESEASKEST